MSAVHCFKPARCKRCGWTLHEKMKDGCTADSCSYRCSCQGEHDPACVLSKDKPAQPSFADVYKRACEVYRNHTISLSVSAWRHDHEGHVSEDVEWKLYVSYSPAPGITLSADTLAELLSLIEAPEPVKLTTDEQLAAVVAP